MSGDMQRTTTPSSRRSRERLRRRFRPEQVKILFIGESPPASGRFFYHADSGLYRAMREAFITAFPVLAGADFLQSFQAMGCYLVDLCGEPVNRFDAVKRRQACVDGEAHLARMLRDFRPIMVVTLVRSIAKNAERAQKKAGWPGSHVVLPYPGRWHHLKVEFIEGLVPLLRKNYRHKDIARTISSSAYPATILRRKGALDVSLEHQRQNLLCGITCN